jgi:hypothetical protein
MGQERTMVSSKLSAENLEFLDEWERNLKPHNVSQSSLVDLCVRIVRQLHRHGDLSLEPQALQELLGTNRLPRTTERKAS